MVHDLAAVREHASRIAHVSCRARRGDASDEVRARRAEEGRVSGPKPSPRLSVGFWMPKQRSTRHSKRASDRPGNAPLPIRRNSVAST